MGQDFLTLNDRSVDRRHGDCWPASKFAEALHDYVEDRDEEYSQHGRGDHSAETAVPSA
jgi:hypothetical protein